MLNGNVLLFFYLRSGNGKVLFFNGNVLITLPTCHLYAALDLEAGRPTMDQNSDLGGQISNFQSSLNSIKLLLSVLLPPA